MRQQLSSFVAFYGRAQRITTLNEGYLVYPQLTKYAAQPLKPEDEDGSWKRAEFELMQCIEVKSENMAYIS